MPVRLGPTDHDPAYPCSDPALYEPDRELLGYMLQDLRVLMRRMHAGEIELQPYESLQWDVHGLARRTVICDPAGLDRESDVCVVGFFGERRRGTTTQKRIDRLERELVAQFRDHPGVLSYSSIELVDDYWANLVVHTDPVDRERWRAGDPHREAAEDASPDHYRSVRIHHGVVPQGVRWSNNIRLLRTKYWDYGETSTGQPVWEAIRDLEPLTPAPRS